MQQPKKRNGTNNVANFQNRFNAEGQEQDFRLPPHNLIAEQSVLGAFFLTTENFDAVQGIIQESDFYRRDHQIIFRALQRLFGDGLPIDIITVSDFLQKHDKLEAVGGFAYIGKLARDTPSAANVITYANLVKETSQARKMLAAAADLGSAVFENDGIPLEQKLANHQAQIESINTVTEKRENGLEVMQRVMDTIDDRYNGKVSPFIKTGYHDIDKALGGGFGNHLVVVGGSPTHGKTTFTMNMIENMLLAGVKCSVFSYEMSVERLQEKMLSSMCRTEFNKIQSGDIDDADWLKITAGLSKNSASLKNLMPDNSSGKNINQIAALIRTDYSNGARVFVIDHAQLIPAAESGMDDNANTKHILSTLMGLKNKLKGSCIILISPCRKMDGSRADKRPQMDDLFGGRPVSGDADVVMIVYRDEVYNEKTESKGIAEVIFRKNRDGEVGVTVRLHANLKCCRFDTHRPEFGNENY